MKKFFSLSAIVAVLAMLMTSVSVSSCSSDDDDDSTTTTPTYTSFSGIVDGDDELNIARSFLSINYFAGSFLSIKDGKIYTSTASADELKDVEIVFNGTNFVTAASSANSIVSTNGNSATLTTNANGTIAYVTSTGYMGTIICTGATGFTCIGTTGSTSSTVTITVKHISCQQVYYSL